MTSPIFTTLLEDGHYRTMILGTAAHGKSVLLQAQGRRLRVTDEEPLQRSESSGERSEHQRTCQEVEDHAESQRLKAVREAFWLNTPQGHRDVRQLHDVLVMSGIVEEPTTCQIKAFFMMLPADIIGATLRWGFSDTEARERAYQFVENNRQAVLAAVKAE